MNNRNMDEEEAIGRRLKLPPGFRFSPTDEELILHFLYPKSSPPPPPSSSLSSSISHSIIPDLLCSQLDPWELNGKALRSGDQYFYFSRLRNNRSTGNGFWKDLGMEEPIFSSAADCIRVGTKKLLAFHIISGGRRGGTAGDQETDWLMEEYRLIPKNGSTVTGYPYKRQEHGWSLVLCRVHERGSCYPRQPFGWGDRDNGTEISYLDEMFLSLDDDMDDVTSSY